MDMVRVELGITNLSQSLSPSLIMIHATPECEVR